MSDEIIAQAEQEAQAICNERNPSKDKDFLEKQICGLVTEL